MKKSFFLLPMIVISMICLAADSNSDSFQVILHSMSFGGPRFLDLKDKPAQYYEHLKWHNENELKKIIQEKIDEEEIYLPYAKPFVIDISNKQNPNAVEAWITGDWKEDSDDEEPGYYIKG